MKTKNNNYQSGFTLVELAIGLAILAIGLALAIPSFQDMVEKKRLKLAAETVMADFNYFKQEGLKQRADDFSFNVKSGANWCYGIELGACNCSTANACSIRQVVGSDFKGITSITSTDAKYDFHWLRGTLTGDGDVALKNETDAYPSGITLTSPSGYELEVRATAFGRVTICTNTAKMFEYESC